MRKVLILLLSLFCFSAYTQAQSLTETIKGKVIDKDTRQPLQGVNVVILNTSPLKGALTDELGNFKIEQVGVGRHTLRFTYLGYQETLISELLITSGKETSVNIEMQEKVTSLTEMVVTAQKDKSKANNEFATVSARSFSAEEMQRYAATQNDPARMVQSFAGVMTAGDDNNQIVVRGNSPRGLLWRMEGIEIPNPNHFAGSEGSTGGGVSILSANMLTNTDFYSGAFPAEYGNALSGVFDLNLRKGNTDKHEFAFQVGVLGLEAALEGPFSKKYKGSYLINYRYSTLQIFSLLGFKIGGDITPKYQDLAFNFYFPTKHIGTFTLFGIGGMSSLGQNVVKDTTKWNNITDKSGYNQKQLVGSVGATHLFLFKNNKTYLRSVISYNYTNNTAQDDTLSNEYKSFAVDDNKFIYKTFRATTVLNHKLDSRNVLRAGIIYSNIDYHLFNEALNYPLQQVQTLINTTGNTSMLQAYVQWKHRFSETLQLNSGVHLTHSFLNGKFYIEPRIGLEWRVTEAHTLSFGAGLHSRMDAVSTYVSYIDTTGTARLPNRKLDFSRALHAVIGYNFNFKRDFRLRVEAYAQYLFNVPIGADSANSTYSIINYNDGFVDLPLKSTGTGYNYGLELTFEKFFSNHYFFMYSASLFESKYKAADGVWRSTVNDVHYVMNLLGGKEFVVGKQKNNIIGLDAKIVWRGGQRYTPVNLAASIANNQTEYDNQKAFSQKIPDYFRVDFGLYFRRNKKKYSWTLSFDTQNIINRENPAYVVYDPATQTVKTEKNLGIVPVLSWKIEFGVK